MITKKIQIAYYLEDTAQNISALNNLSYVHKISKYDVNGNLISWTSALNNTLHALQPFTTIEPNTAYIVESNSTARFPYNLFVDADTVAHQQDIVSASGHLRSSLTQDYILRDKLERDFSEAVFSDLLTASGALNSSIVTSSSELDSKIDVLETSLDARIDVVEHIFNVSAVDGAYVFSGNGTNSSENPDLYLSRGETYKFHISAAGHPFYIKTLSGNGNGNQYTSGITGNGSEDGTLIFTVPQDSPQKLYYNCSNHSTMKGTLFLTSGGSGGSTLQAGSGIIRLGGSLHLEDPKVDFQALNSGVFSNQEESLSGLSKSDRIMVYDDSNDNFKYAALNDIAKSTYINLYDDDLRPEYVDGGGATEFGPFGPAGGGGVVAPTNPPVGNRPTLDILTDNPFLGFGETATITFLLSEASTDFVSADVTVVNGSISSFSGSGANYTAIFTPQENIDMQNASISVGQGAFTNSGGQSNTSKETSILLGTLQPTTTTSTNIPYLYNIPLSNTNSVGNGFFGKLLAGNTSGTTFLHHNIADVENTEADALNTIRIGVQLMINGERQSIAMITYNQAIVNFSNSTKKIKIEISDSQHWDVILDPSGDSATAADNYFIEASPTPSLYYLVLLP